MADKRIKGITIEIDGKTTGLTKALKAANSEIKNTKTHLKDIEKALKIDPGNTELLEAKQRALNAVIEETKKKLEMEKEAAENAKEALANGDITQAEYDALQAEIVRTTDELKNLEKQARQSASVLGSQMQAAGKEIQAVGGKIQEAGKDIQEFGGKLENVGKKITKAVTLPIIAGGTAAVKTAANFDSAMSQVEAISGATGDELEALRDKAREMGSTTKFSATEAAEAMNYMAMAGWEAGDMMDGIEGIMNLAAASGEDLASTSDIVTDALTALGMTAEDTSKFVDILAATSTSSNTNVSMLGESFKYVASTAGTLGYSAEDLSIALGTMANAGVKGSQAGNTLKTALARMAAPTDEVAIAMEDLGISMTDSEGNTKSLMEVMQNLRSSIGSVNVDLVDAEGNYREFDDIIADLSETTEGLSQVQQIEAASTIFGKNAMAGMLTIVNATEEDFNALTDSVYNSNGAAENMAAIMQDNLGGQLTILKSQLEELAISVGEILMPYIRQIVGSIQGWVDKLNSLDEGTKKTIITVAAIVAAIGPVIFIIGKITTGIGWLITGVGKVTTGIGLITEKIGVAVSFVQGSLIPAITGTGATLGAVLAPIAAVVLAIMAVITIIKNWHAIVELGQVIAETVSENVKNIIEGFKQFFTAAFQAIGDFFKTIWDNIVNVASAAWQGIQNIFSDVGAWFTNVFQQAWNGITGIFNRLAGFFQGVWNSVTGIFKSIGVAIADAITGAVKTAVNNVLSGAIGIINGFIGAVNAVIGVINAIPGVSLSKLSKLNVPQLAQGGVLKKGEVGLLEGNGAEAVVPLDQNEKWVAAVAREFQKALAGNTSAAFAGTIIIPVNIGQEKITETVIKANQINNYRSGGR